MPVWFWVAAVFVVLLLLLVAAAALLVVVYQDKIVYAAHVDEQVVLPEDLGYVEHESYENVVLTTRDGEKLHGVFFWAAAAPLPEEAAGRRISWGDSTPTVLWLHENAGSIASRLPQVSDVVRLVGCNVFIFDYRGYGASSGTPSEQGLKIDAEDALLWLTRRPDIDKSRVVVFGRSLGGAVAVHLATEPSTRDLFAALLLENTFASLPELAVALFSPLRLLLPFLHNHWGSVDAVRRHGLRVPTLFFAALRDRTVPHAQMLKLYLAARSSSTPKARDRIQMRVFAHGGHMTLPQENLMYHSYLRDWLDSVFSS